MAADWENLLLAYLHDPPDKALGIHGHVERACRYAGMVLDRTVRYDEMKQFSDVLASIAERLPAPKWETLTVNPVQDGLQVNHPLSGKKRELKDCRLDVEGVSKGISEVLQNMGDNRRWRLLALWRLLPDQLAKAHSWFVYLPADTRIPDHTIWHHLDTTTALKASEDGGKGAAFLSFSLGPVQSFISTARSVRDLWSGSMILSWLTFQAMLPVIEAYGPMAFVYPHLRGIPFLDRWLREPDRVGRGIPEPDEVLRRAPCLPNRFLALVPWGPDGEIAQQLAEKCKQAVNRKWYEMAESVRQKLKPHLDPLNAEWDKRWDHQIAHFWGIQTAVLPCRDVNDDVAGKFLSELGTFQDAFPDAADVRGLAEAIPENQRPGYDQKHAGRWQSWVELSARLMQAQRSIRHIAPSTSAEEVPPKCSLMGSYEQMGPADSGESRRFWEAAAERVNRHRVWLRSGERFCAVALVKRFCAQTLFTKELDLDDKKLRFDDTASVASAEWLKKYPEFREYSEKQRSSHWLH